MVGIYKIINTKTGSIYIGQSKNIERRLIDHCTLSHNIEIVDKNINLWGKENFKFEVLEECTIDQLDQKEIYYINLYNATENGYNKLQGGQLNGSRCGENNGNAKITDQDVYYIRECYKNHKRRIDIYQEYKDKLSESSFNSLWQGQYRTNIHMDVYIQENLNYYIGKRFTDEEVYNFRKRYVNETAESIYQDVKDRCSFSTFKKILYGERYKNVMYYDKTNKIWKNI